MGSLEIVVINPISDFVVRLIKRNEIMLPHTFLFETPKESLNHAVLFRRVWRNILLMKPIFGMIFSRIRASSKAPAEIPALPDRENLQPTRYRSQQSITATRWHQPSCFVKRCVISIAQRLLACGVICWAQWTGPLQKQNKVEYPKRRRVHHEEEVRRTV